MVEIDGSEAGGQVVRTALSLSMVAGEPVELTGIRGDRPEPGLGRQHLTAVETAADICNAALEGAQLGATELAFDPGEPAGGTYEADIGTAGSVTLLFDAVLPVATCLDDPLTLRTTGGTDVKWSPPMTYYRRVKLNVLRANGLAAAVEEHRPGFYPVGGGAATLSLWPSSIQALDLTAHETSEFGARVYSKASADLADADVAERQADEAVAGLESLDIDVEAREVTYADTDCPGSVVVVRLAAGRPTGSGPVAGFDAYGEKGKPAEEVAADAVDGVREFLATGAAVDPHLADQLLVFLALGGGRVAIPRITDHVRTSLAVFEAFGYDLSVDDSGRTPVVAG